MKTRNLIISIIAIIFLVVLPFFVAGGDADFGGADDKGGDLIEQENPGYEPWFEWQPELPGEVESGLFVELAVRNVFCAHRWSPSSR